MFWFRMAIAATTSLIALITISMLLPIRDIVQLKERENGGR